MPSPSRRRSTSNTDPPIRANPIKWMLAMRGKIHGEPRIADSSEEYCSHSKSVSNDIPAPMAKQTHNPQANSGLRAEAVCCSRTNTLDKESCVGALHPAAIAKFSVRDLLSGA